MSSMHEVDRISSLHDSILSHILSFLSTKYSVATSVLAQRWRSIWTKVPVINLDLDVVYEEGYDEKITKYQNFVSNFLFHNKEPCLRYCCLILPSGMDSLHVGAWIDNIVKRNVKEIDLNDCTEVSQSSVLTCEKVEILTCQGCIFQKSMSVHLPNLYFLELNHVMFTPASFMGLLVSSCHALREFVIDCCTIGGEFCVHSSSLKKLKVIEADDLDVIVLDTPSLEYLMLSPYYPVRYDARDISSLRELDVDLPIFSKVVDYLMRANILEFLKCIAASLTTLLLRTSPILEPSWEHFIAVDDDPTYLELPEVLDCTPNLVHLTIACDPIEIFKDPEGSHTTHVPSCLLHDIKVIEIREFDGSEGAMEMVSYLLMNARVLNEMKIDWTGALSPSKEEEIEIMSFPRGSSTCEVTMFSASLSSSHVFYDPTWFTDSLKLLFGA